MKELKVKDIIRVTNGKLLCGDEETICNNFSKDTRTIQKGDIYIGLKGEKFNGSDFWEQALENGAEGVIVQGQEISKENKEKYSNKIIIEVEDTLEANSEEEYSIRIWSINTNFLVDKNSHFHAIIKVIEEGE